MTLNESGFKDISTNCGSAEEQYEDEEETEELGSGGYLAAALGVLVDEKINYTIDGMNYALDALSNAVGMNLTCGYEAQEAEQEQ